MARLELRDTTIRLKDGLSGTAQVNESPSGGETDLDIDTIVLNTTDTDLVPVGARFTIAGEANSPIHTVTARTPAGTSPTTNITFTPAIGSGVVLDAVITFLPQQLDIKIGEGNLTYTENKNYTYELDKGNLDTVREEDQAPLEISLEFVYEFVTTGTSESVTPVDALKQKNGAAEWVSSSSDQCEPYSVDVEIEHDPPCGTAETETTLFADFRYDSLEFDLSAATISVTGRCNVTEPTITRS